MAGRPGPLAVGPRPRRRGPGHRAALPGHQPALALVDQLDADGYPRVHAVRADLLRRLGREGEAADAYQAAIANTDNQPERDFLRQRLAQLA